VQIPLYYPTTLPAGLSVVSNSFRIPETNTVVFDIQSSGGLIAVSEQPRPSETQFDINNFYTNDVSNPTQFLTALGQATVGTLSTGKWFGSLLTDQTWIIVTAPANVSDSRLHDVLSAMQPLTG
jgi:hypothetical protein